MPLSPAVRRQSMSVPLRLNISSSMVSSRTCSPLSTLCSPSPLTPSCKCFYLVPLRRAVKSSRPGSRFPLSRKKYIYITQTKKYTCTNGNSKLSPTFTASQFDSYSSYATIPGLPGPVQTPEPSSTLERIPRSSQPTTHEPPVLSSPDAVEPVPRISHHKSRGDQAADQGPENGRGSGCLKG